MMAAVSAAQNGNNVTLIEQNEKLGKKLFLTGKGRCNLTNACSVEELFDNIATNPKFLYSAFYGFDNTETVRFFNEEGLPTKVERGGRVFPVSDHSSDVIKVLKRKMEKAHVKVLLNTRVTQIVTDSSLNTISGVIVKSAGHTKQIKADKLIMATGGRSYPLTGSDGSSFEMIRPFNIKVVACEPSLVPFVCNDGDITSMQGLALKNVGLTVKKGDKLLYSGFGEILFTHFGMSGPLVLSASSHIRQDDYGKDIKALIDLKSALSYEELDRRVLRDFEENRNRNFGNSLSALLPSKLITTVIKRTGIPPEKKVNSITKEERKKLCEVLKSFEVAIDKNRGFDEAIITRGGVAISEIVPSTMEPTDQVKDGIKLLEKKIANYTSKGLDTTGLKETLSLLTDRVTGNDGVSSISLSKQDCIKLAELAVKGQVDLNELGISLVDLVGYEYIVNEALNAGITAALMSLALRLGPALCQTLMQVIQGQDVSLNDIKRLGITSASSAGFAFVNGAVSAGVVTAMKMGVFGKNLMNPNPGIVGLVSTIVVDIVFNSILLKIGKISSDDFHYRIVKDSVVAAGATGFGLMLAGLVSTGVVPFAFLLGSLAGAMLSSFVFDKSHEALLSLCWKNGLTLFGLVSLDYQIPENILRSIGIKGFDIDTFEVQSFNPKKLPAKSFEFDSFETKSFELGIGLKMMSHSVIGAYRIGYSVN